MHQREEAETSDAVASTFSFFDQDAYVLFDPGSTHSYISVGVVCYTAIPCVKMDYDVLVTSPLRQEVKVNRLY